MNAPVRRAPHLLMCEGKQGLESAVEAAKIAKAVNRRRNDRGKVKRGQVAPYRCVYCGLWHLGRERRGGS